MRTTVQKRNFATCMMFCKKLLNNVVYHVMIYMLMKYMHKKTKVIGEVIHYKGVTTTLRLEDGRELILTPAQIKNEWIKIE